jgi:Skp family chaperone for outer membrane proteins
MSPVENSRRWVMLRSVVAVLALLALMTAVAVFAAPETATQKTDNDKQEFQQKTKAKFDEYDMKFKEWSEKAKAESGKEYQEQKKELERHRVETAKDIHRLNTEGKAYGEKSWRKMKEETNKSLDKFGKALERAGAKLRKE